MLYPDMYDKEACMVFFQEGCDKTKKGRTRDRVPNELPILPLRGQCFILT